MQRGVLRQHFFFGFLPFLLFLPFLPFDTSTAYVPRGRPTGPGDQEGSRTSTQSGHSPCPGNR